MIFVSKETYVYSAVIPRAHITLVSATRATNEGFPEERAKHRHSAAFIGLSSVSERMKGTRQDKTERDRWIDRV